MRFNALILCSLLIACAPVPSKELVTTIVPIPVAYSKPSQAKAADEIDKCNCPTVVDMMKDYKVLRDQCRIARAGQSPQLPAAGTK